MCRAIFLFYGNGDIGEEGIGFVFPDQRTAVSVSGNGKNSAVVFHRDDSAVDRDSAFDPFQISKMRDIVHSVDAGAFITITEVADVFKANIEREG